MSASSLFSFKPLADVRDGKCKAKPPAIGLLTGLKLDPDTGMGDLCEALVQRNRMLEGILMAVMCDPELEPCVNGMLEAGYVLNSEAGAFIAALQHGVNFYERKLPEGG